MQLCFSGESDFAFRVDIVFLQWMQSFFRVYVVDFRVNDVDFRVNDVDFRVNAVIFLELMRSYF